MQHLLRPLRAAVVLLPLGLLAACAGSGPTPVPDSASRRDFIRELPPPPATVATEPTMTGVPASASRHSWATELPLGSGAVTPGSTDVGNPPSASRR